MTPVVCLWVASLVSEATLPFFKCAGLFVYPLDEYTTVVGFEAVIAKQVVTVQIRDKAKIDDCSNPPNGRALDESGERVCCEKNF